MATSIGRYEKRAARTAVLPLALVFLCVVPFLTALVVSLVTSYLVSRRGPAPVSAAPSALEALKVRYAKGELTPEQYEDMRRELQG